LKRAKARARGFDYFERFEKGKSGNAIPAFNGVPAGEFKTGAATESLRSW
jgi:hypothetical protein